MGKILIIKDTNFSESGFTIEEAGKPNTEVALIPSVEVSGRFIKPSLQVGDEIEYFENQFITSYLVWSVPVEYKEATYRLVSTTQYGPGDNTVNNNHCVFAAVLDSNNIVVGVIVANSNDASLVENDTYLIDMSKYENAARLQFSNNQAVTVTVLPD